VLPPLTSHDRIFNEFDVYLRKERGLAPKSIGDCREVGGHAAVAIGG
jgi:hypothetical protein